MLTLEQVAAAAASLDVAEETKTPTRQFSLQYPDMTVDDAYAIQRAWTDIKFAQGRTLLGRKIGLTSRAMQQSVNITEPDHGTLLDDMFFADGSTVPLDRFIGPRVEVELAFVLGTDLRGPGCTIFDVLRATEYVTPALEILDARVQMSDPETGHDLRQRRRCRHRHRRPRRSAPRRGPPVGVGVAVSQWGDRGVGRGGRGSQPSGERGGVAGEQAGTARGRARGGPNHPRRLIHPARVGSIR